MGKLFDDVIRSRYLVMNKANAEEVEGVRVAPLAAVVTNKGANYNDYSLILGQLEGCREDLTVIR